MKSILIKPIITEKSMFLAAGGSFTFAVAEDSTKQEIMTAVKKTFNVDPITVSTLIAKGEVRRSGRKRLETKTSSWKKAIITLKQGQKIDLFDVTEGVNPKSA